jgi:hypothetical protein
MLKVLKYTLPEFNPGLNPFMLLKNLALTLPPPLKNSSLLCMVLNMPDKTIEMIP